MVVESVSTIPLPTAPMHQLLVNIWAIVALVVVTTIAVGMTAGTVTVTLDVIEARIVTIMVAIGTGVTAGARHLRAADTLLTIDVVRVTPGALLVKEAHIALLTEGTTRFLQYPRLHKTLDAVGN